VRSSASFWGSRDDDMIKVTMEAFDEEKKEAFTQAQINVQ
jgi:hypothetical protein